MKIWAIILGLRYLLLNSWLTLLMEGIAQIIENIERKYLFGLVPYNMILEAYLPLYDAS